MNQEKLIAFGLSQLALLVVVGFVWYFVPLPIYTYIALAFFVILFLLGLFQLFQQSEDEEEVTREKNDIELNTQNIVMLIGAILFLGVAVFYGFYTADKELEAKRRAMMQMDIEQVANHIIEHNRGRNIDPITKIVDMRYQDNVLTFYYRILLANKSAIARIKERVTREFQHENCTKVPPSVFLAKEGTLYFRYYQSNIDDENNFVFDVNVTKEDCK